MDGFIRFFHAMIQAERNVSYPHECIIAVKDREVEIMEKLYEAFLDNWEKHAPDFLLFLWGAGIFKLPGSGNEPFGME